jgi:hypothetical protein
VRARGETLQAAARKIVALAGSSVVLLLGCGGDEPESKERAGLPPSPLQRPEEVGQSGTERARACELLGYPAVRRVLDAAGATAPRRIDDVANDSLDLSICDWHGGAVDDVRISIDSAPRAQLRFYNMLAEQLEYHNANPTQRPRQLRGVGQDSAYGGAGAWWTSGRKQLVAYSRQRVLRVRVVVAGLDDTARRRVAAELARLTFRRLGRA